ncbi:CreA family protein [Ursidibacter sp. B-7004-1]
MKVQLKGVIFALGLGFLANTSVQASDDLIRLGSVSTKWNALGKNDRIEVVGFQDKDLNVTCYLSYAEKGGLKEVVGLEEDTSDGSIHCVQTGNISDDDLNKAAKKGQKEQVFKRKTSLLFKSMQVVRFIDFENKAVVYLNYSDRVIEGSPKNSISVVKVSSSY